MTNGVSEVGPATADWNHNIEERKDNEAMHDGNENDGTKGASAEGTEYAGWKCVTVLRCAIVLVVVTSVLFLDTLQTGVNKTYALLMSTWIFNSVYFETFFATYCYAIIIPVYPWLMNKLRFMDIYKIHPSVGYQKQTIAGIVKQAIVYMTPLMTMDTFMVKKYHGVDPVVWTEKRLSWIQQTRALPFDPPSICQITYQLICSLILYDILFFSVHFVLHKNYYLYKYIHKHHHDHETMHSHVTNQLSVPERITLILSANHALKMLNSHPLTRLIFIPVFIGILVDNHTGYDTPFGIHRIVPFGLVGGSVKHYDHHMNGKRNYQPIMKYLDQIVERIWKNKSD